MNKSKNFIEIFVDEILQDEYFNKLATKATRCVFDKEAKHGLEVKEMIDLIVFTRWIMLSENPARRNFACFILVNVGNTCMTWKHSGQCDICYGLFSEVLKFYDDYKNSKLENWSVK